VSWVLILQDRVKGSHFTHIASVSVQEQALINLLNVPILRITTMSSNMDYNPLPARIKQEEDGEQTPTATAQKPAILTEKDNDTITVCIGWNSMTSKDWILCAEHAGDYNWRMTRKIASKNVPEGFNFIYRDAKLIQVQYCQPCRDNGEGYKGRGMSYREKDEIEKHFVEIYDPYHPYVYVRKATGFFYTMLSRSGPPDLDLTGLNDTENTANKRKLNNPTVLQGRKATRLTNAVTPNDKHGDGTRDMY
jgi:hypothetical protein